MPITNGIVQWEDMTHLYTYTFEERLKIDRRTQDHAHRGDDEPKNRELVS